MHVGLDRWSVFSFAFYRAPSYPYTLRNFLIKGFFNVISPLIANFAFKNSNSLRHINFILFFILENEVPANCVKMYSSVDQTVFYFTLVCRNF